MRATSGPLQGLEAYVLAYREREPGTVSGTLIVRVTLAVKGTQLGDVVTVPDYDVEVIP